MTENFKVAPRRSSIDQCQVSFSNLEWRGDLTVNGGDPAFYGLLG